MKSLLLYLALVGIPVAALLGILREGRGLDAPHDVAGEWRVEAPPGAGAGGQAERAPRTLRISQSGVYLTASVDGGGELRGRLRGDTLRVVRPADEDARGGCASAGFLLYGIFDLAAEPDRLTAGVVPENAPGCHPAAFTAVRERGSRRPGAGR
ncbi:MAG TPA: hypothetical protein VEW03_04085 [Longimicrobiaceae bacterium]|nr:hypothetical protein [Longimicrobiaceae bacterium]